LALIAYEDGEPVRYTVCDAEWWENPDGWGYGHCWRVYREDAIPYEWHGCLTPTPTPDCNEMPWHCEGEWKGDR
jgi:hypothetical protein